MHFFLIVRHFPPEISGGARRPYLLSKALTQLGHKVTIVSPFKLSEEESSIQIPHPAIPNASSQNSMHVAEKKSSNSIIQVVQRVKSFLRQWFLWPEPNIRWAKKAEVHLLKTLPNISPKPDVIITTSPPESLHIVGANLKRKTGIPWVAEMRDTWVETPHRKILERSKIRAVIEKKIARNYLVKADGLTTVSDAVLVEAKKYIHHDTPVCLIDHFSIPSEGDFHLPNEDLNIVHTGGFELSDRNRILSNLLFNIEKCQRVRDESLPIIHLHLAGRLSSSELDQISKKYEFKITFHGQLSLQLSRDIQNASDALVLHTPPDSHALPGKYAEYCFAKKPILYLGGGNWLNLADADKLLHLLKHLPTLKKGTTVSSGSGFTSNEAALKLSKFIQEEILTKSSIK
ncbi:glycosyltransferase [Hirschia maritima]|uniref:glycosyltransferase n=1 Tax=Hirschia maritima TaxID=1121961 RepID=UPI0003773E13|nr:glycosyltransferase [Hirschia maritima]